MNKKFLNWINTYLSRLTNEVSPSKVEIIKRVLVYDDDKIHQLWLKLIEEERNKKIEDILK